MHLFRTFVLAAAATFSLASAAYSVEILKREPNRAQLKPGVPVFVDDGSCPKGQVAEIVAATAASGGKGQVAAGNATPTRRCVPRPS